MEKLHNAAHVLTVALGVDSLSFPGIVSTETRKSSSCLGMACCTAFRNAPLHIIIEHCTAFDTLVEGCWSALC